MVTRGGCVHNIQKTLKIKLVLFATLIHFCRIFDNLPELLLTKIGTLFSGFESIRPRLVSRGRGGDSDLETPAPIRQEEVEPVFCERGMKSDGKVRVFKRVAACEYSAVC